MSLPIDDEDKELFHNASPITVSISMTDSNNTTMVVTNTDIVAGTFCIDRTISSNGKLELGECIASELSMTLFNEDGKFDSFAFEGATLTVTMAADDVELDMGVFIVDGSPKVRETLSVSALDKMTKFDYEFDADEYATTWASDNTIKALVTFICNKCGVSIATTLNNLPNATTPISTFPNTDGMTYRQMLGYACACMGKCGYINGNGYLQIGFTSTSDSAEEVLTESERFSSDYEDYSCTYTGVMCTTTDSTVYVYGTTDYAFDISNNPIAETNPQTIVNNLSGLAGLTYRPMTATTIAYPWLMPMDVVEYKKGTDIDFRSIVTSVSLTLSRTEISSVGENPTEKTQTNLNQITNYEKQQITEASSTATKYITEIGDDGIKVHDETHSDTDYVQIDSDGLDVYQHGTQLAHFGTNIVLGSGSTLASATTSCIIEGSDHNVMDGENNHIEGTSNYVCQNNSHIEGNGNSDASDDIDSVIGYNHIEGRSNITLEADYTHIEGYNNSAKLVNHTIAQMEKAGVRIVKYEHIEGYGNALTDNPNDYTAVSGNHIEGSSNTVSNGQNCHIEGANNSISGSGAATSNHIGGVHNTIADSVNQVTVIGEHNTTGDDTPDDALIMGKYNDPDDAYMFSIGNGTSDTARSNCFGVDASGNTFANNVTVQGHSSAIGTVQYDSSTATKSATAKTVYILNSSGFTLAAGTWIICAFLYTPSASSSNRWWASLTTSNSTSWNNSDYYGFVSHYVYTGCDDGINISRVVTLSADSTFYLKVYSNIARTIGRYNIFAVRLS